MTANRQATTASVVRNDRFSRRPHPRLRSRSPKPPVAPAPESNARMQTTSCAVNVMGGLGRELDDEDWMCGPVLAPRRRRAVSTAGRHGQRRRIPGSNAPHAVTGPTAYRAAWSSQASRSRAAHGNGGSPPPLPPPLPLPAVILAPTSASRSASPAAAAASRCASTVAGHWSFTAHAGGGDAFRMSFWLETPTGARVAGVDDVDVEDSSSTRKIELAATLEPGRYRVAMLVAYGGSKVGYPYIEHVPPEACAGDDGGDSSRGDGKGSHDYWFCVRSKMARRIAPGLLLVYRWNLDSH